MIRLGLIGAGRIGKIHGEVVTYSVPNACIKMVSDINLDGVKEWADGLGVERVTSDHNEILQNPDIDAIMICSSTDTHADLIIEGARAGKHIFCEKPVDYNIAKIKKALAEVKKAGVKLQIGFNRRFDHNFASVRSAVQSGTVGDVHLVKVSSRDCAPPPISYVKVSGGIFLDMTIHDFDMVRFLSGSEVSEVFAYGAVLVDSEIGKAGDVDTALINLKFENGAIGVIDNSREAVYGYDQRVEVFGSKGVVMADNDYPTNVQIQTKDARSADTPLFSCFDRYADSYRAEDQAFVDAVEKDTDTLVVGNDGLAPVLIALAANKSLNEGRSVKISEIV